MKQIREEDIEPLTLQKVPEIWQDYYEFGWDPIPPVTDEWVAEMFSTPLRDERRLGYTIVIESILVPFLMTLFEDEESNRQRIEEIMAWIEELAQQEELRIWGGAVGVCVCEALLGEYGDQLPQVFPYLGSRTKAVCQHEAKRLNLEPHVRQFLADSSD